MRSTRLAVALVVSVAAAPAVLAEAEHKPNAAPLESMQRARSYALVNRSGQTIVTARVHMTNSSERDLTWDQPVLPNQGRDVAVPSADCVESVTVSFKSGRTLQSNGTPDCRNTRITVTENAIQFGSSASDRPPPN